MNGRLYRSRDERVIAGVAGGLGDYFAIDPSLVRVLWVLLAVFSGGAFLIVYIVMALVVPEEPWEPYAGAPPTAWTSPPAPGGPPQAEGEASAADATTTAGMSEPPAPAMAPGGAAPWQSSWQERHAQREAWRAQRRAERAARRAAGGDGGQTGAIVFGLILVAIGVAFLLPLVFPGFAIGRYWPVLLIGLGAVLLIAALRPGRPPRT
jgi:phage shock protein C